MLGGRRTSHYLHREKNQQRPDRHSIVPPLGSAPPAHRPPDRLQKAAAQQIAKIARVLDRRQSRAPHKLPPGAGRRYKMADVPRPLPAKPLPRRAGAAREKRGWAYGREVKHGRMAGNAVCSRIRGTRLLGRPAARADSFPATLPEPRRRRAGALLLGWV